MSLIGLSPTITATRTIIAPLELANSANVAANTTVGARVQTATRPVTAAGRLVLSCPFNYMVLQTLNTAGATSVVWYAIGWTFSTSAAVWVPKLLTKFTVTPSTTSGAEVSSLRPGRDYVKNLGDLKIYNGEEASCPGGFVIIDVAGSELVELQGVTAAAGNINALIGYI
jgi:hypothetical protein